MEGVMVVVAQRAALEAASGAAGMVVETAEVMEAAVKEVDTVEVMAAVEMGVVKAEVVTAVGSEAATAAVVTVVEKEVGSGVAMVAAAKVVEVMGVVTVVALAVAPVAAKGRRIGFWRRRWRGLWRHWSGRRWWRRRRS